MLTFSGLAQRLPAVGLLVGLLVLPLGASAQELPSYAEPAVVSTDETIHGRIAAVDGAFNISVDDDRGFVDNVELHQGTIINPTGLALSPGMNVTIMGYNAGSAFEANEIDTPYSYSGPLPAPEYYGAGYWCPGFAYGYGPAFSLAIVFGFGGAHHYEHRPFHGRPWNGHGYFGHYAGNPYGGRRYIAERRVAEPLEAGARRVPSADIHGAYAHAPSAFSGRSFAGRAYAGAPGWASVRVGSTQPRYGPSEPHAFRGGHYWSGAGSYRAGGSAAGGYARSAPAPSGFVRGGPAGGGFARAAAPSGGFARGSAGVSMHGGGGGARR